MKQTKQISLLKCGRVEAIFNDRERVKAGSIPCVLDRDLTIRPEIVSLQCYRHLPPILDDLVRLAGVVAYADKMITRTTASTWGREMEISLPVSEPERWNAKKVRDSLVHALELVTGDCWNVIFRPLPASYEAPNQLTLEHPFSSPPIVIPYSDGLDSYAVRRIEDAAHPEAHIILVTVGKEKHGPNSTDDNLSENQCHHWFPFALNDRKRNDKHKFRESSYRSRSFAYTVAAGMVAYLTDAKRIVLPESGQGIFGPSFTPVANEAPDVRTHPLFTRCIEDFLYELLGKRLKYIHPRLFNTKAETLRDAGLRDDVDWKNTRSCPRGPREVNFDRRWFQCGVCSACLLRRMSILAADLDEEATYFWHDLKGMSLDAACVQGDRKANPNDISIAKAGVMSHIHLADFLDTPNAEERVSQTAKDLSGLGCGDLEDIKGKMFHLLKQNRAEWKQFVDAQGENSFITKWWDTVK